MTTAAEIGLRAARLVTDVMNGTATAGSVTSLTDTNNLIQPNAHWDRGTVFILSGTHEGKVAAVTGYASNRLTFSSLGSAIAAGVRYAVMRGVYPWEQILTSMETALSWTHVTDVDNTLEGDGETLEFTLPTGVYNVKGVQFLRDGKTYLASNHWREINGVLRFDPYYAPADDDVITVIYRKAHDTLTSYSVEINSEINTDWLVYKTAEDLLWWALGTYNSAQEYRIEERMNRVMAELKTKTARRDGPDIVLRTAGIYI